LEFPVVAIVLDIQLTSRRRSWFRKCDEKNSVQCATVKNGMLLVCSWWWWQGSWWR